MMGMRLKSEGVLMSGDCVCAVVGGVVVGVRGYMRVASRPVYHPPHFTNRSSQPPPLPPFSEFPASEAICSISPGIMEIREEWRVDYGLQVPPSPLLPSPGRGRGRRNPRGRTFCAGIMSSQPGASVENGSVMDDVVCCCFL